MAGKKGKRKKTQKSVHKGMKVSTTKKGKNAGKLGRGLAGGQHTQSRRPLKLLKWARDRMKKNLPKLEALIDHREARGEK